ncbi:hypothetical protein [Halorubrum amylolyticum]|uniref:hypothetical protein n=1 Tax=Halorubrum amylolyticum TaxID=2508724 RepID=UPI0010093027|nr:hypothetical protein [Halorubrum amylolyticum]
MHPPSTRTLLAGLAGGIAHLIGVEALFRQLGHVPETLWPLASLGSALSIFAAGFLVAAATAHTGLASLPSGLAALLGWATYRDVTTPDPTWSELGGQLVVDGDVFLTSYVGAWHVWLGLLAVAAAVEFGLRREYGLADARLRSLSSPDESGRDDRSVTGTTAIAVGGVFGVGVAAQAAGVGVSPAVILPVLVVTTGAVGGVAAAGALRGLVTPAVGFAALVVPTLLRTTLTGGEGGPVFLLLLGPLAVGLALVGAAEEALRRRLRGR